MQLRGRLQHYMDSDREVKADLQTMERGLLTASDLYKMAVKCVRCNVMHQS